MTIVRLALVPVILLGCSACLSLDFMFLDAPTVDRYDLDPELVPADRTEVVQFDGPQGMLAGAWAHQDPPAPPLVFLHGNGGNVQTNWDRVAYYWGWGTHDVFAPDYTGYGMSEGTASFEALSGDGEAILRYVSDATGVPTEDIPVIALSLGGFVALHGVDDAPVSALVLQSVFANSDLLLDTSLRLDVPPGWFFADDWENDRAIASIDAPVFIIHGLADDFIDPDSGPILFDAASDPKELWQPEGVDHADLFEVLPEEYRSRTEAFFAAHGVDR